MPERRFRGDGDLSGDAFEGETVCFATGDSRIHPPGQRAMTKAIFLIHRYLGLALCLIMAAWCLSGIVMIFVGYPALSQQARIAALPLLSLKNCCRIPENAPDLAGIPLASFEIEMLEGRPSLRLVDSFGPVAIMDLSTGDWRTEISINDARRIAAGFFGLPIASAGSLDVELVGHDQWTVSGEFDADRPLFKVAKGDPVGMEIYVSSSTGKVVQETTRYERGWNWVGAVVHWIYFTELRSSPEIWSKVVIWASLLGVFLTITGLWYGVTQIRLKGAARWTPYRGLRFWHHLAGLIFGIFTLAWVASGLLSMNPWGLLVGSGAGAEAGRLRHFDLTSDDALAVARHLAGQGIDGHVKRIASAPLDGHLYLMAWTDRGPARLDGKTLTPAPLSDDALPALAALLDPSRSIAEEGLISKPDDYYFGLKEKPVLPVYRVILDDADRTRYYLDPRTGQLLQKTDRNDRLYRWLFEAMHRWDFAAALRQRGVWDAVMLLLMSGVSAVCLTGVYMGYRYLFRRRRPRSG